MKYKAAVSTKGLVCSRLVLAEGIWINCSARQGMPLGIISILIRALLVNCLIGVN